MHCNVLYISNEATMGGAAQSLLNMIKILKENNITPFVIIPSHGIIEEKLRELSITYYVVPFSNGYGKIAVNFAQKEDKNFKDNYFAALQLQEIIKREKINLVHINSSVSNVGAFAALMAGIPYVWHFREFLEEDFDCEFWDKELKVQLMQHADSIITISKAVSASYKRKYGIDSVCIYDGLDIVNYKNDLSTFSDMNEKQKFIITGAITPNKGQLDAVKAIKLLVGEGTTNIHLDLIGHGPERFRWFLKQYIHNNELDKYITVIPFQNDLSEYRKQCHYALTTSKMEALGRCTIEAMLAGNIVIGADTGGTKEIIGEDETKGYLYKQGDYIDLAAVMKRIMAENLDKKRICRQNAQTYAEETFALEKYSDAICTLYKDILDHDSKNQKPGSEEFLNNLRVRYNNVVTEVDTDLSFQNSYTNVLEKWSKLTKQGISVCDRLKERKYTKMAIYGMGNLGCKLYEEIVSSGLEVPYVIDRNAEFIEDLVTVKSPDEELDGVDVIIVAVSKEEQEIVKRYKEKFDGHVIGISKLISSVKSEE